MDKLRCLEAYVRVVELGSFTRAAEALHLPKGSVTKLVQSLESELGVRLLQRTTRRLAVTEDGLAYFEGAQRLLADLSELDGGVTRSVQRPRGRLRVDVPAAAGRHVITPALPEFFVRFPDVVLEIGSSDRPVDLLAEGVDCVIRGGLPHDDALVARALGAFEVITCAAPAYLARWGAPALPQDLHRHLCVNFFSAKTGRIFPFEFERDGERIEITGPHRVAANDADTYVEAGLAGLGILQSPRTRRLQDLLDAGRLVPVLTEWSAGSLPLYVMYPRNRHLSARVRVFVDWVVDLYARKFSQIESVSTRSGTP